jgi:hypothetical protein
MGVEPQAFPDAEMFKATRPYPMAR